MKDKIPTAAQFINSHMQANKWLDELTATEANHLKEMFVEFAKMHLNNALESIYEKQSHIMDGYNDGEVSESYISKYELFKAYPESNIQ
jgi:hypothetical protein